MKKMSKLTAQAALDRLDETEWADLKDHFQELKGFLSDLAGEEEKSAEQWNSYHFNVGDSNTLGVGYCARVTASSDEQAVELLQAMFDMFDSEHSIYDDVTDSVDKRPAPGIEYLKVYFGQVNDEMIDEVHEPCLVVVKELTGK